MGRYLKSIMKTMPVIQARQIVELLDSLRAKGEVRNAEEYQDALRSLAGLVNAENPSPTFSQVQAIAWYLCSSDAHNTMMTAAKNDIEAIFLQTDEMGQRLEDQHTLLMTSTLSELEHIINEQEETIRKLQLIGSSNTEFNDVLLSSFGSTSLKQINRSEVGSDLLFFDNRTGHPVSEDLLPNAYISENGNKLILPTENEPRILPISVSVLTDSDTYGTELEVAVNNNLSNIIDGTNGTYWTRTVYLSEPVSRISTFLQFDFGAGRDVNYVIIQGASSQPFYVTEIWGIAPDGHKINLILRRSNTSIDSSDSLLENLLEEEIEVDGSTRIDFEQVFVKSIQIKFSYSSYEEGDFWVDSKTNSFKIYDKNESLSTEDLSPFVQDLLLSQDLGKKLGLVENTKQHINGNVYFFGLDNVWFGNGLYYNSGIFVSQPITTTNPGVISIQTKEKNVNETKSGTDEELAIGNYSIVKNAGSVEYEIIRKRITDSNTKIDHFPIPFLGQTKVIRERLVLTKRINNSILMDAGNLRFTPRITNMTSDIQVYKNNTLMTIGSGPNNYSVAFQYNTDSEIRWTSNPLTSGSNNILDFSNWNLPKQTLWILINSPSSNDIYTVSYNIRTSLRSSIDKETYNLTPEQCVVYIDDTKTIRIEEDGKLMFVPDNVSQVTESCELYLQITLRRNTSDKILSPEVSEFALLVAPYK